MPKRYKLKFGGSENVNVSPQPDNTMLYVLGFCLICCCCCLIVGGISYYSLPKCDDKDESDIYNTTCDDLQENNSSVCFGECKKSECCDELKCVHPEEILPRSMVDPEDAKGFTFTFNAQDDFDSSGNIKNKPPNVTCNEDDGWGPDFNIKRCTNEDKTWSLECDDSIELKCKHDEFDGVSINPPHGRTRTGNCRDINVSESGEGPFGNLMGIINRVSQLGDDDHQKSICRAHYSISSGSKGNFCDFDSGIFTDKCKTSSTVCRGPG